MKLTQFRFPSKQQELIWQKRRQEDPPSVIARDLGVSRALVSKAQRIAEERIERTLLYTASANRIRIRHISPRYGFAVGYCLANKSETYIVYSPALGTQLWFSHRGDCEECTDRAVCERTVHTLADEWEIRLAKGLPATEAAEELFTAIMRRLKWME